MNIEALSNGFGGQSMWMLVLAIRGELPATVSISADTGWENDCLWNTGRRSTAREYFDEVIVPLCTGSHVTPYFVRAVDDKKEDLPPLQEHTAAAFRHGRANAITAPLFGSNGGRMKQICTDKWKVRAIQQQLRRLGAKTARNAQGIHFGEAARRIRGNYLGVIDDWHTYQSVVKRKEKLTPLKWITHYYPLVDLRLNRQQIRALIEREGIPYMISSQCNGCPHQDLERWERLTPETLQGIAEMEKTFHGDFFFTSERIPLLDAIEIMRQKRAANPSLFSEADFGCQNDVCGV